MNNIQFKKQTVASTIIITVLACVGESWEYNEPGQFDSKSFMKILGWKELICKQIYLFREVYIS